MAESKSPLRLPLHRRNKRRTKEDPRFVIGRGRYVADIALPGMKHVALVASPARERAHRLDRRRGARWRCPACTTC